MRVSRPDGEFNPADPYDAMCENFRLQIVHMMNDAQSITIFREMSPDRQLSAFLAGVFTGAVGVAFCMVKDRDEVMRGISNCLPVVRRQAEDILDSAVE